MTAEAPEFAAPQPLADKGGAIPPDPGKASFGVPPAAKKVAGRLGANKKPRSGIRALTAADKVKIQDYYEMLAWAVGMVKPAVHDAIMLPVPVRDPETREVVDGPTRAELCAEAWMELGNQNDSVRRMLLWLIESGAWSQLFAVNMPILLAALPDDVLTRAMHRLVKPKDTEDTLPFPDSAVA